MTSNTTSPLWRWNWQELCGAAGLKIWSPERHDFGLCFQQLALQIPVYTLLACSSSYYFGRHMGYVIRGPIQLFSIKLRCFIVLLLALLPLLEIYINLNKGDEIITNSSYLLSAVKGICWFSHLWYTLVLRKRLGLSPRGPVFICVMWTLIFVLNSISLRSYSLIYKYTEYPTHSLYLAYGFSICQIILQIFYGLTLIPSEGNTQYIRFNVRSIIEGDESQPLLNNAYIRFTEEGDPSYLGVAMEYSNCLSKLLFYWVNPLMEKGVQGKLNNTEDLYDLPIDLSCGLVSNKLDKALIGNIDNQIKRIHIDDSISTNNSPDVNFLYIRKHNVPLLLALHRCYCIKFYSIGILKLISDCANFCGPLILNQLLDFIENKSINIEIGYLYVAGLFFTTLISSLCDSHFNFQMALLGLKMKASLVTTIYRKTLTVSETILNSELSLGEIVNFMSTDTDRIVNSCPSFHALWSIPLQIIVTLYLLYLQVGLAFVAGLIFIIILIPINKLIATKIGQLSTKLMNKKDVRIKMITEILKDLRENELKYLKGRKYLDALCVYFWATTPILISIFTFGTYVLLGNKLTASNVFTGIALLNMLISPLNAFPWVLNGLTEAWVSIKRIQKLLNLDDINYEQFYDSNLSTICDINIDININDGHFYWKKILTKDEKDCFHHKKDKQLILLDKGKQKKSPLQGDHDSDHNNVFGLTSINLEIQEGEFVGIIGTVGCGKSSLLLSILGELSKEKGQIMVSHIERGYGYVSQQPWLQRGTIRENILFGKIYDDSNYKSVIFACGLEEDLSHLPAGDLTSVGESGDTLSGGQKVRIALARAVYQNKSIYFLDDILSAVDNNVAKHIFQHCILGLLKTKTVLLCTHHIHYLKYADRVILMENGRIKKQGTPNEVLGDLNGIISFDTSESAITTTFLQSVKIEPDDDSDSLILKEISETGSLNFSVYATYWKAIGHWLSLGILFSIIFMQISRNLTDWWLSYWVTEDNNKTSLNISNSSSYMKPMDFYLKIYVKLAILNTIFTLFRAFLFAYGGITAAMKIHKTLLRSVIKAKSTFFDVTPLGRILNRLSSDIYTIDDSLPFILNILLAQFFGLLGTVFITMYGLPWICIVLIPLIPVYHWLQHNYRLTSRELKRISSVTLSPVYSHFNESLQGLTTIRAMRATQRFKRDNEDNIEANIKAQFASQAAARWLGIRLQFIGVTMVTGISLIGIIQHQYDVADPGLVGLALSYALSITGTLSGVISAFTETEKEMISVERVNQYVKNIVPETMNYFIDPPFGWPIQGVIHFNNVVMKYRDNLLPSLKGISFETRPCEKIGVIGRTGAGKSSLIPALFRLIELHSGSITIDTVDISRISLSALRARLFCIPQEPFLFSGSLRENIDPLNEFRENEIWSALTKVNLSDIIRKLGGLDKRIEGSGINFSMGQKQLICLARAVLHNAKILCVDEATANVDMETDRQIQLTLRSAFRNSTVITIAHRIQTILDSDRVLVMNDGKILEFDNPNTLLEDADSYFYQLFNQHNLL